MTPDLFIPEVYKTIAWIAVGGSALVCLVMFIRILALFWIDYIWEPGPNTHLVAVLPFLYVIIMAVMIFWNLTYVDVFAKNIVFVFSPLPEHLAGTIYLTHLFVISAFLANFSRSILVIYEIERGIYGGSREWGQIISGSGWVGRLLEFIPRIGVALSFLIVNSLLFTIHQTNLYQWALSGQPSVGEGLFLYATELTFQPSGENNYEDYLIREYRNHVGRIAEFAVLLYCFLLVWVTITSAIIANDSGGAHMEKYQSAYLFQMLVTSFGLVISFYMMYLARGFISIEFSWTVPIYDPHIHTIFVAAWIASLCAAGLIGLLLYRSCFLVYMKYVS